MDRPDWGKKREKIPRPERERPPRVEKDPEETLAELEKAFGEELNPALREVLDQRKAIRKWLSVPENAAAFKEEPVEALRKEFPDLGLKELGRLPAGISISLKDLEVVGPDQPTRDFFVEVWQHVAASEANASAFQADQQGTIALLGQGKPEHVVQRVIEAFNRVGGGGRQVLVPDLGRIIREIVLEEKIDPIGPIEGLETVLKQVRLPRPQGGA
jgi:hypothetical protein